jgi:hypothetical protein
MEPDMKRALIRSLAMAAMAAGLAACNGGGSSSASPTLGPTCVVPSPFTMIYPENGSSVSATIGAVYIAVQSSLANTYNTGVQPANGVFPGYYGGTFTQVPASQIPTPHAKPGFANPIYYASSLGQGLYSGVTYQIGFNNTATNCTPAVIDTFTTY